MGNSNIFREYHRSRIRELIRLAQNDLCLFCNYSLHLGCHLHHVIARDDFGPDHVLNLVGLCPNHHMTLETVRRHVAPSDSRTKPGWLPRASAVLDIVQALPESQRRLFDALCTPHPLREQIRNSVPSHLRKALAIDIARADAKLLAISNSVRPHFISEFLQTHEAPRSTSFAEVIALHLEALHLPFAQSWLEACNDGVPAVVLAGQEGSE